MMWQLGRMLCSQFKEALCCCNRTKDSKALPTSHSQGIVFRYFANSAFPLLFFKFLVKSMMKVAPLKFHIYNICCVITGLAQINRCQAVTGNHCNF